MYVCTVCLCMYLWMYVCIYGCMYIFHNQCEALRRLKGDPCQQEPCALDPMRFGGMFSSLVGENGDTLGWPGTPCAPGDGVKRTEDGGVDVAGPGQPHTAAVCTTTPRPCKAHGREGELEQESERPPMHRHGPAPCRCPSQTVREAMEKPPPGKPARTVYGSMYGSMYMYIPQSM